MRRDDIEREKAEGWSGFAEQQVVREMADTKECLAFRVLVDEKVDYACPHKPEVLFQQVISYKPDAVLSVFFQDGSGDPAAAFV